MSETTGVYCYWIRTREQDNGDLLIARLETVNGLLEIESEVTVPAAERRKVALELLGDLEPIIADIYSDFHLHPDSTMQDSTPASRKAFGEVVRQVLREGPTR